jgi:hypothetical protein
MTYRLASRPLRRAAGFILAAVAGRDLHGVYYPNGLVGFGSLLALWDSMGQDTEHLMQAATVLTDSGRVRVLDDHAGIIVSGGVPSDSQDPEMSDRGGYYPEVVPLTAQDDDYDHASPQSVLPVGLGGSSKYDWDQFEAWNLEAGTLTSHLGRLFGT